MLENEAHIINQAQRGNSEYFGLLYDHYLTPIYRFVFLKVSTKAETEDLVHEIFLSAWKNIEDYDHLGFPFSSWLYQIARHKVIDYYRTKKNNLDIENISEENLKVANVVESELDKSLDLNRVKDAIKQLGEDQQNVLIMRFIEDLSYSEISAVLDKSEGAIRLIQHRAIQNLKQIIRQMTETKNGEQFI